MLNIYKASIEHIPIIRSIAHMTWPSTFSDILSENQIAYMLEMMYSESSLLIQMTEKEHQFYIGEIDGEDVAYSSIQIHHPIKTVAKIHKIYVLPTVQGYGAGKALIGHMHDIAKKEQCQAVTLNVNRYNKAVDFYKKLGYQISEVEDIDIGNGFLMEDYVMVLDLNE